MMGTKFLRLADLLNEVLLYKRIRCTFLLTDARILMRYKPSNSKTEKQSVETSKFHDISFIDFISNLFFCAVRSSVVCFASLIA